ncbi:RING-H2 finger protein ATL17-like [Triticum dicoccoides]|uniref:RING-H2 finger protein ATL17-like n=1 Tax=Triticum dicoccoides TaxID=85692 RepID=UPI001890DDD1|nr:RING-H2 finger protein ATL17-like [Triticum dicoccoides]
MSSLSSSADLPWQARGGGAFDMGQGSAMVLASYPVLLLLVLLSAFVREYAWIALALYCTILFLLSCTGPLLAGPVVFVQDDTTATVERGGLSQASITAIPAFVYGAAALAGAGDGEAQCAVCLEALSGGEKARRLPVCAHTFHVGCIDMWFHSHATWPLCLCHVEPLKAGKMWPLPPEPPLPPV